MNKKFIAILISFSLLFSTSFATTILTEWESTADAKMIAPVYQNNVTYSFDDFEKAYDSEKNVFVELKFDKESILKKLWIDSKLNLTNITLEENSQSIYIDLKNWTLSSYKVYPDSTTKAITEAQAKTLLAKALSSTGILSNFLDKSSDSYEISQMNQYYPYVYASKEYDSSMAVQSQEITPVDDEHSNEDINKEYYSVTFIKPLIIWWKEVYDSYWNKQGTTIVVDSNWIQSVNISNISLKAYNRKSELMSYEDFSSFAKRWGNNPYYSYDKTTDIKLDKISNVYVLSNVYLQNENRIFLSSWYKLESSNTFVPYSNSLPYSQVISKYKITNPSLNIVY